MEHIETKNTGIVKYVASLKESDPQFIRRKVFKMGILSSYNADDGRMIFYTSKNTRFNNASPFDGFQSTWLDCNGFVMDTKNMKPLVIPIAPPRSQVRKQDLVQFINKDLYDIFLMEDGTVISLYYWIDEWRISSNRGYDVSETKWGDKTYREILHELLKMHNTEPDIFYETLDKSACYTFGIKHDSMHKFREGKNDPINKIWFIQSVKYDNPRSPVYDWQGLFGINNQTKYEDFTNVDDMFSQLYSGLNDFFTTSKVLYGFILRSKDINQTGTYSNILLESSLMQKIRLLQYSKDLNDYAKKNNFDKELSSIIHGYVNVNNDEIFIGLFPQYKNIYDKLNVITDELCDSVNVNYDDEEKLEGKQRYVRDIGNYLRKKTPTQKNKSITRSIVKTKSFVHVYANMLKYDESR